MPANDTCTLRRGSWWAEIAPTGTPRAIGRGNDTIAAAADAPISGPIIEIGGRRIELARPSEVTTRDKSAVIHRFVVADAGLDITVRTELRYLPGSGAALETEVVLIPERPIEHDVAVRMSAGPVIDESPELFAPLRNGVGLVRPASGESDNPYDVIYDRYADFTWHLAGGVRTFMGSVTRALGLPLVSEGRPGSDWRLTWCADPYFTTGFRLRGSSRREIHWRYPGPAGLAAAESRRLCMCVHEGGGGDAIEAFYASALRDVPSGPAWLHDIALAHYDYLAGDGDGWFRDIDTLADRIPAEHHHKVCVCLHGWYDVIGRYSMNERSRTIEDAWTALVHRSDTPAGALDPVPMNRERICQMLRYARDRGFRTVLYYGDGLVADSQWAAAHFPAEAVLKCGGWEVGIASHAVILNPLHPDIRRWFTDYTKALLDAWGADLDGLVWDETYYITAGERGPAACPGYADRAWMTLMQEVARIAHAYRRDLAVLGSDCLGTAHSLDTVEAVAYSLVVDGCWQDTECEPNSWAYGLFPNWRNVLWSCNWAPEQLRHFSEHGVRGFGAPVPTSNGYLESRGPSDMTPEQLDRTLALFAERVRNPRSPFWLTEDDPRIPHWRGPDGYQA